MSGLGTELRWLVFMLFLMTCHDRLNITRFASAEHSARRVLQIQWAVRRNAIQPDFTGLDPCGEHMGAGLLAPLKIPLFDKHVMELQMLEAFLLMQA